MGVQAARGRAPGPDGAARNDRAVADAILDWIDPDDAPRPFGAEADYYQGLAVPYAPRNGVPQCLEELLLVRGVTRDLLFGADANFNHRSTPRSAARWSRAGPSRSASFPGPRS